MEIAYVVAYFIGGVIALALANWLWYPAPDLHGVQLGLLMAGIFLVGSAIAVTSVAVIARS